jgi:murein DD-endopeptidase MepM/ murein hydrolase activator NlpD
MTRDRERSHTGRTVAVVGGGALFLWLLFRGRGWGLGGSGTGDGGGAGAGSSSSLPLPTTTVEPRRCKVRVASNGITVDGKPTTVAEAVAACKSTQGAEVVVTGGARQSDFEAMQTALQRAGIHTLWFEPKPRGSAPTSAWVFPVPTLGDRRPEISDGWGSPRTLPDGTTTKHLGADLMFRRRDPRDLVAVYKPGTVHGERWYFMPDNVPALAAAAGVVHLARWTPVGFTVIIRHPTGWATYYTHLSSLAVSTGDTVTSGQPIGIIGGNPADRMPIKHLHFELWRHGTRAGVVDPRPYLDAWPHVTLMNDWAPAAPIAAALRNAGLVYRPVGDRGEPYPEWLRRVRGSSGVYIIRERGGPIVYVGVSAANRLYETLTRHLQDWRRYKGFWRGQFAEGHDPGLTYDRASVEVAVKVMPPDDALDEEARLIRRLRPRDNLIGQPDLEAAPF